MNEEPLSDSINFRKGNSPDHEASRLDQLLISILDTLNSKSGDFKLIVENNSGKIIALT